MVLSSISLLFLLMGDTRQQAPSRFLFVVVLCCDASFPNLFLWLRIRTAMKLQERRELAIGSAEDHRDHILVYLFAILLPALPD
jgi:hypothetical protein